MMDESTKLFLLGLGVLSGWTAIILFFSRPQLFRSLAKRYLFCCCYRTNNEAEQRRTIRETQERLNEARKSIAVAISTCPTTSSIMDEFLLKQNLNNGRSISFSDDCYVRAALQKSQALQELEKFDQINGGDRPRKSTESLGSKMPVTMPIFEPITEVSNSSATSRDELS